MTKRAFETTMAGFEIRLEAVPRRRRHERFRVTYGLEVHDRLDYGTAAFRLGQCIMHAAACEGRLEHD